MSYLRYPSTIAKYTVEKPSLLISLIKVVHTFNFYFVNFDMAFETFISLLIIN